VGSAHDHDVPARWTGVDVEQAILAHEGQGRAARQRFSALDAKKRADLLEFLKSL